jgi:small subunit ribosomal protein S5
MSQEKKEKTFKKTKSGAKEKWSERVVQISRVTKVCKGGKKLSFRAVVVIGNEMGQVGVGVGKADDVINAITKGITDAKKNLIYIELTKTNTISHLTIGNILNNARATICALQNLKTPAKVALERNLPLERFFKI